MNNRILINYYFYLFDNLQENIEICGGKLDEYTKGKN